MNSDTFHRRMARVNWALENRNNEAWRHTLATFTPDELRLLKTMLANAEDLAQQHTDGIIAKTQYVQLLRDLDNTGRILAARDRLAASQPGTPSSLR